MRQLKMARSMFFSYFWVLALSLAMFSLTMFLMKKLPVVEHALFDYSYGLMTLFTLLKYILFSLGIKSKIFSKKQK